MSAARAIARSIRTLRLGSNLNQGDACELLALEGVSWSPTVWSAAERSAETRRVRVFTADEIAALARMFRVPVCVLFGDPHVDSPTVMPSAQRAARHVRQALAELDAMLEGASA